MFHLFAFFCLCWWDLTGVFGNSVLVKEGDSVTLHTGVKIQEDDDVLWKYGAGKSRIAKISFENQIFSTYDGPDGRFRHRLKLDHQTGSLTITNISTEHAGDYKLEINGAKMTSTIFTVSVYAPLPTPNITRDCASSSCSVVCSVVNVSHVTLSWLKGNSLLSSISVSDLSISLSLPLEVEDQDTNNYSCVLNNSITHQTTHLDICGVCPDPGVPLFYIVLISVAAAGSLVILAGVVICCICRKRKNTVKSLEEHGTDSTLSKPSKHQTKPKTESVYENLPKKR